MIIKADHLMAPASQQLQKHVMIFIKNIHILKNKNGTKRARVFVYLHFRPPAISFRQSLPMAATGTISSPFHFDKCSLVKMKYHNRVCRVNAFGRTLASAIVSNAEIHSSPFSSLHSQRCLAKCSDERGHPFQALFFDVFA